jgi:Heavy metal associated domain 2
MDYQIVHAIEGRIRIRIPLLAQDEAYANKLKSQVESLNFVINARINPLAESIVVTYKFKTISCLAAQEHICQVVEQASPPKPPSPSPVTDAEVFKQKFSEVSATVAQESVTHTIEQINLDEDPWEDKTTRAIKLQIAEVEKDLPTHSPKEIDDEQIKDETSEIPEIGLESEAHTATTSLPSFDNTPIKTSTLAKRLDVTFQVLTKYKSQPDFSHWSQVKDPDNIGWVYNPASKSFRPIKPPSNEFQKSEPQEQTT